MIYSIPNHTIELRMYIVYVFEKPMVKGTYNFQTHIHVRNSHKFLAKFQKFNFQKLKKNL